MAGPRDARGRFARRGQAAAVGDAARAAVEQIAKSLVLHIDANLRRNPAAGGTPVDTGHARANWLPGVSMPPRVVAAGTDTATHDAGIAAVLAYTLSDGPLYESNNVPYMRRLNQGYSPQANAGFIEAAIDEALATVAAEYAHVDLTVVRRGFQDQAGALAAENLAAAYDPFGGDW